jgi:hypothetical protein
MTELSDDTIVKLQSNDDKVFEVSYKVAKQSATIKNMLDGMQCCCGNAAPTRG